MERDTNKTQETQIKTQETQIKTQETRVITKTKKNPISNVSK